MYDIYLARHGETIGNKEGKLLGRLDSPLTEESRAKLGKCAALLEKCGIGLILASPIGRAMASARIYADILKCDVKISEELIELSNGDWEGRQRDEFVEKGKRLRAYWDFKPPGGESYNDGLRRVINLVDSVKVIAAEKSLLVVGHAGTNQLFLKIWFDLPMDPALFPLQPHDIIFILNDEPQARWIDSEGKTGSGFKSLI